MSRELKGKARGSNHGSAKLTDEIVLEMRKLGREYGLTSTAVAKKFGVSNKATWAAMTGETWTHLPPETVVPRVGRGGNQAGRKKHFTNTEKYSDRRYIVAKVDLDKQVSRALMEFAQKLFDDHGVKLECARFDWVQISKIEGMAAQVTKINLETTVYR